MDPVSVSTLGWPSECCACEQFPNDLGGTFSEPVSLFVFYQPLKLGGGGHWFFGNWKTLGNSVANNLLHGRGPTHSQLICNGECADWFLVKWRGW